MSIIIMITMGMLMGALYLATDLGLDSSRTALRSDMDDPSMYIDASMQLCGCRCRGIDMYIDKCSMNFEYNFGKIPIQCKISSCR